MKDFTLVIASTMELEKCALENGKKKLNHNMDGEFTLKTKSVANLGKTDSESGMKK